MIEKVLVTGGAGFIGSYTVDLLLQKGYKVRVLDALVPPVHLEPIRPAYLPSDVELVVGDVRGCERRRVRDAVGGPPARP